MVETPKEQDPYEADFALGGEVEFEEQDEALDLEIELLAARVQAARFSGA